MDYSGYKVPALAGALAFTLAACGGDSSNSSNSTTTSVSGSVFAAPVSGAGCELQTRNGATLVGPFTTSAGGAYNAEVPNAKLDDDLMLICSGGSYTDEAVGSRQSAGTLAAYVAGGSLSAGDSIHATPGSTIIHQLVARHDKTLSEANSVFNSAFGYTPDTTVAPTDATGPASGAADDERLAGLRAAAFSQLTADMSLDAGRQFALLAALAQDLSDDSLDGRDVSGTIAISGSASTLPADIQHRFGSAMLNFRSGNDATGLANDKIGNLPFARTVISDSYQVEYLSGVMGARQGETEFQLRITQLNNDQPLSAASVTLMPIMYMATLEHGTPVAGCSESASAGTYDCTAYYLMASRMMDGMPMGYWRMRVRIDNGVSTETADFHPAVMMAMGDTVRADLKGVDDKAMNMMSMLENRRYHLFNSGLSGSSGDHDFELFIAVRETMMSMPALVDGATLNAGESYELTPDTLIVQVSTDLSTWVTATTTGDGYWTAQGLTGLSDGTEAEIYVKLSVSGEQKTTNGQAADGSNDYATFTVTPGASM